MEQEQVQEMTDPNTTNLVAIALKKTADLNQHIQYLPDLLTAGYNEIVTLQASADEAVARLTAERDEARRMVCGLDADTMEDQREYAKQRGWDCFPQESGQ